MSHVDDGALHGYLDGGLSALDAVRVERHVAECAACRQRLEQARGLVQRAARLLEWATPPVDRAAPPLADHRPAAAPRWQVPLAWAATIVLALGAGIYGGQALLRPRSPAPTTVAADRSGRVTAAPITAQPAGESDAVPVTVPMPAAPAEAARAGGAREAEAQRTDVVTQPAPRPDTAVASSAAPPAPPAGLAAAAPTDSFARVRAERQAAAAKAATSDSEPAAAVPLNPVVTLADSARLLERRALAPAAAPAPAAETRDRAVNSGFRASAAISVDSARALLGSAPVTIPDLPVSAIRADGARVTIEQVVPPGRLLRLVQWRADADEAASSEPLVRYVGGLRVEISGVMAPDSLALLLLRARAP